MKPAMESPSERSTAISTGTGTAPSKPRDPSLDFAKGLLVEVMILFHSLQYFLGVRFVGLNYLAFVTGAFVFLAGSIVTEIYLTRFQTNPRSMLLRLIWRSVKLLVLFSSINIAFRLFFIHSPQNGVRDLLLAAGEIFGAGSKRIVIFEMLVPIAYTLAAAALIAALARTGWLIGALSISAFVLLTIFASQSFNAYFLGLGLLGVAYGLLRHYRGSGRAGYIITAVSAAGAAAYFISIALMPEDTPWIYAAGVVATVETFRSLRLYIALPKWLCFTMEEFGRYSLFAYIAQIGFLRVLLALIGADLGAVGYAVGPIIACNIFLLATMVAMSRLRSLSSSFDTFYRTIFG